MISEEKQQMTICCQNIMQDMVDDSAKLDGLPFDGKTVAVQLGQLMAAIHALANITQAILLEEEIEI